MDGNVIISRPNLINWKPMKYLFHGVMECVQENRIMVQYGIMNRFVYGLYEETPILSFVYICLLMHQNSW